jgi:enoyl-CoA hydratase/carnithine racemase
MNALSADLVDSLFDVLEQLKFDDEARVVVITGAGEKAFCAGADLKERKGMTDKDVYKTVRRLQSLTTTIAEMPKPVIAAVNGYALGGGFEIALACDVRLASDNALMGLTEARLGIIPGAGGTQRLARLVGASKAKELVFTAKRLNAEAAKSLGIVSDVHDVDSLRDEAVGLAATMTKAAPLALREAKFAIDKGSEVDLATGLAIESRAYDVLIPTKDRVEALKAFNEKRDPDFQGE